MERCGTMVVSSSICMMVSLMLLVNQVSLPLKYAVLPNFPNYQRCFAHVSPSSSIRIKEDDIIIMKNKVKDKKKRRLLFFIYFED